MAVTVINRGKAALKAASLPASNVWTAVASVTIAQNGSSILVAVAINATTTPTGITWNGLALTRDASEPSTNTNSSIWSRHGLTAGTGALVLNVTTGTDWSSFASAAVTAIELQPGALATVATDKTAVGTGTSGAPATAATATTAFANEFLFGTHSMRGPSTDTDVTTNAGNTGTRETVKNGTTGGSATTNIYQDTMYGSVTATGAYKHSWSGATSLEWAALIATYSISPEPADTDPVPSRGMLGAMRSVALLTFAVSLVTTTLAHQDTFFSGPGIGPDYDWPNPRGYPTPTANRTWTPQPLVLGPLLNQDQFYTSPGNAPDFDWENPRGAAYPVALRSWLGPSLTVTSPFLQSDWPNPQIARRPIDALTWLQSPAVVDNTQLRAPTVRRLHEASTASARQAEDGVTGSLLGTLLTPVTPTPPFVPIDLPNPRGVIVPVTFLTWTQSPAVPGGPCVPVDWPNPKIAVRSVDVLTWRQSPAVPGTPVTPFDWPNPRGANGTVDQRTWIQSPSIELRALPSLSLDWPNPRGPIFPISLRGVVNATPLNLIGQDQFFGAPGEASGITFQNPTGYAYPTSLRTWIQNALEGELEPIPIALNDWPVPRGYAYPIALRTWLVSTPLNLLGRDQFFGAPGQGPVYDYPNPRGYAFGIALRTWTQASAAIEIPVATYDWPNPHRAARPIDALTWTQSPAVPGIPVLPFDWPNPKIAPRPIDALTWAQSLAIPGTPVQSLDWLNPRGYAFPSDLRTFLQNVTTGLEEVPSAQLDWPNPRGAAFATDLRTFVQAPVLVTSNPLLPFDWPNPRGYTYPVSLRTWLQSLAIPGTPVLSVDWPTPRIAPRPVETLTWTQSAVTAATPFSQTDWPNPHVVGRPSVGATWSVDLDLIGQDQFFTSAGRGPTYDWPNPRGYAYPTDLRTFLHAYDFSLEGMPVPAFDWPNPRGYEVGRLIALRTWTAGPMPESAGGEPFAQLDWPNPKIAPRPIDTRTWAQSPTVPGTPATPFDWPNPRIANRPVDGLTWAQSPAVPATPIVPIAWPNPRGPVVGGLTWIWPALTAVAAPQTFGDQSVPRAAVYSVALRTWTQSLIPVLVGQDRIYGAPGEVPTYDWPNPHGPIAASSLRTWTQSPAQLAVPFRQSDWPNPTGPVGSIGLRTWTTPPTATVQPFATTDWPVPAGAVYPVSLRTFVSVPFDLPVVPTPFVPPDLPNPRGYPYPTLLRTWAVPRPFFSVLRVHLIHATPAASRAIVGVARANRAVAPVLGASRAISAFGSTSQLIQATPVASRTLAASVVTLRKEEESL